MTALEQVRKNILANLESLENKEMIRAVEARFEEAQKEHDLLQAELSELDTEAQLLDNVAALRTAYEPALENWPLMNRSEKRIILHALIEKIDAEQFEEHGLRLIIEWKDKTTDEIVLPGQATTGTQWLSSEAKRLLYMVDQHYSPAEIAREFPTRTWQMIRNKVYSIRGKQSLISEHKPIRDRETYQEYLKRTDEQDSSARISFEGRSGTIPLGAPAGSPWVRPVASAHQPRMADRVMRRAEWPRPHHHLRRQGICHRVDAGHIQRLIHGHSRQDARHGARQQRLARARRPNHDHVIDDKPYAFQLTFRRA